MKTSQKKILYNLAWILIKMCKVLAPQTLLKWFRLNKMLKRESKICVVSRKVSKSNLTTQMKTKLFFGNSKTWQLSVLLIAKIQDYYYHSKGSVEIKYMEDNQTG